MENSSSTPQEVKVPPAPVPKSRPLTQPERIGQALDDLRNDANHRPDKPEKSTR